MTPRDLKQFQDCNRICDFLHLRLLSIHDHWGIYPEVDHPIFRKDISFFTAETISEIRDYLNGMEKGYQYLKLLMRHNDSTVQKKYQKRQQEISNEKIITLLQDEEITEDEDTPF